MLNMYQLWLDDLYPRAKFADALAITEKVGHTKRMQIMRKEWIDEGKPRRTSERDDEAADHVRPGEAPAEQTPESMEGVEQGGTTVEPESGREAPADDDNSGMPDGDPDDDELDALLAESARPNSSSSKTLPSRTANADHDPFADEMEAMADMDDLW
jgi:replication fork protection complex subunit Csm3/Swi3